MKCWIAVAVLSLILVSPAAANDGMGEWIAGSSWKGSQWVINTKTGEMRVCIIEFPHLQCAGESKPDSAASDEVEEEPDELELLSKFKYIGPAKPAED